MKNENISSRAPVYESYDKNVQGRTILERGTSEAGVVSAFDKSFPKEIRKVGFSAAIAHNPKIGKIDPYLTAQHAILGGDSKNCIKRGNPRGPNRLPVFWQPRKT